MRNTILRPARIPRPAQMAAFAALGASELTSRITRHPVVLGSPVMAMVEPTTACQLRCPHCPTGRGELTRPAGTLTLERFRQIWDKLRPPPFLLQLWNQGEPLANRETPAIIRHATASGARVSLSTNVELLAQREGLAEELVRAGLAELILSLDGATASSHTSYRVGGSWEQVEEGVRRMVEAKRRLGQKHPTLTWQFLLFRHNLSEVDAARKLARSWGVDRILFKTAQLEAFDEAEGRRWLPEERSLRRYDLRAGRWRLRRAQRPFCRRIYGSLVVQWDGSVVPCCFDKEGDHELGNLLEQPFEELWRGPAYQAFRQRILTGDRPVMCANCTEGLHRLYAKP